MKNFIKFYQNWQNFSKKFRKNVNEINEIHSFYLESINLDISMSKTKIKKNLFNFIFYAEQAF